MKNNMPDKLQHLTTNTVDQGFELFTQNGYESMAGFSFAA
jgi:hypothetical protein